MMMQEFEKLTGFYPTAEHYAAIEEAYLAFGGDKADFCKAYLALHSPPSIQHLSEQSITHFGTELKKNRTKKEATLMTLLTRKEAADRLGVAVRTLDEERATGRLAYIQRKPNGKVWITEEALEEYLARATHPARPTISTTRSGRRKFA